jgi:hypothetical protein
MVISQPFQRLLWAIKQKGNLYIPIAGYDAKKWGDITAFTHLCSVPGMCAHIGYQQPRCGKRKLYNYMVCHLKVFLVLHLCILHNTIEFQAYRTSGTASKCISLLVISQDQLDDITLKCQLRGQDLSFCCRRCVRCFKSLTKYSKSEIMKQFGLLIRILWTVKARFGHCLGFGASQPPIWKPTQPTHALPMQLKLQV